MRIGPYEVVRSLGAGGMSTAWLARGPLSATRGAADGLVVLKRQLRPEDDESLREEARVGMRLRHPGVVQTLGILDDDEGRPVLVLEYVAGASLAQLRKRGPLAAPAVSRIGADVAEALMALHDARDESGRALRILHRDVTPANIIVSHDGNARLIDLGIARSNETTGDRTATGTVKGTLRYVAPELFEGKEHAPSTDLWALGVCLFEASLGRPAVTGPEALILAAVVRGQLLQMEASERIDPALHEVIQRLCNRDVAARFSDARAAAAQLGEGDRGDGAMLASIAVYAAVNEPRPPVEGARIDTVGRAAQGPASAASSDDGFARAAAATYCGQDDDDPFAETSQASTIMTPSAHEDRLVPAPVTVHGEGSAGLPEPIVVGVALVKSGGVAIGMPDFGDTAPVLASPRPPPTSPDTLRSEEHLDVPSTNPGTPGGMRRGPALADAWDIPQPITGEDRDGHLAAAPPTAPTVDDLPSAERSPVHEPSRGADLVDLREQALGAPSIIAIVVVIVAVALGALVAISR